MNILYEIVGKNVHTFMKKNMWLYCLTSVETNNIKYWTLTMLESLNYSFRNPKNII